MRKIRKGDVFVDQNDIMYIANERFIHFEIQNGEWWLSLSEVGDYTSMEYLFNVRDIKQSNE